MVVSGTTFTSVSRIVYAETQISTTTSTNTFYQIFETWYVGLWTNQHHKTVFAFVAEDKFYHFCVGRWTKTSRRISTLQRMCQCCLQRGQRADTKRQTSLGSSRSTVTSITKTVFWQFVLAGWCVEATSFIATLIKWQWSLLGFYFNMFPEYSVCSYV